MLNLSDIDSSFRALAEPTRRAIVDRLSRGPASVSDLARPFDIPLAAVVQHLQVLEESGLIRSEKVGRVRTCRIDASALTAALVAAPVSALAQDNILATATLPRDLSPWGMYINADRVVKAVASVLGATCSR